MIVQASYVMNIIRKFIGPESKYDKSIPYTYEARIDPLDGMSDDSTLEYYFSDTLCGLVEFLDKNDVRADEVKLFGIYQDQEVEIDTKPLLSKKNIWLKRPLLCRSLEDHYSKTMELHYKGHKEKDPCSFEDRDRKVI